MTSISSSNPKYAEVCRDYGFALLRGDYDGARGNAYRKYGLDYTPSGAAPAGRATAAADAKAAQAPAALNRGATDLRRQRTQSAEIRTSGGRLLRFHSNNALIGREPSAIGLKSGFTSQAGKCLIALAENAGHRVWTYC